MKKESILDYGWLWLVAGAFMQGLSIDIPVLFVKGICLTGGTILMIHGWSMLDKENK